MARRRTVITSKIYRAALYVRLTAADQQRNKEEAKTRKFLRDQGLGVCTSARLTPDRERGVGLEDAYRIFG
jgi:hypothetical protein